MGAHVREDRGGGGGEESSLLKESFVRRDKMIERGGENESGMQPSHSKFSMTSLRVFLFAAVLTTITVVYASFRAHVFLFSTPTGLESGRAFFIFGDSYSDVGNLAYGPQWVSPYGITWPGYPMGRFSDGHLQSDLLATQVLGIQSPPAFVKSNVQTLSLGINFAVAGAGVTFAYGTPNISTQVGWFESIVKSRIYTEEFLASSVTLLCIAGNDYATYRGPLESYVAFTEFVVNLIEQSLRKLYSLGLRNIMVTAIAPLSCLPASTILTNFTACSGNATVEDVQSRHNLLLESSLLTLSKDLLGINFVFLRQGDALEHIQQNMESFNITEPFKPCCLGACGRVDGAGNVLYTLCENPKNHVVWDDVHPTQAAWENVVKLYVNDEAYTTFVPTLKHWTQNLK